MVRRLLGVAAALVWRAQEGAGRAARVAVHHVATAGDLRRLWRCVGDLNERVARLEPRGEPLALCAVCGGGLHLLKRAELADRDGTLFTRTVLRCADCWALRPMDAPRKRDGDAAGEVGR